VSTVVVTGIAGSLGRRVARLLAGREDVDRVVGIDSAPEPLLPAGVEYLRIDLAGGDDVEALLAGVAGDADGIIHLAWRVARSRRPSSAERRAVAGANHLALRRVLSAAESARPASLVHLSSATVYGAWPDNPVPLPESAPLRPNPATDFAVGKADAERMVAELAGALPGVAVAILRPAATVGSTGPRLYGALGGTAGPRPGDLSASRRVQYLHVDDLAGAVVAAWSSRLRGAYNVAPDAGITEATARSLAGGIARVSVPPRIIGPLWSIGWSLGGRGVPRDARQYALAPWAVAGDRLRAAGWSPRYTSEEALVAADVRPRWDDIPPPRRQRYTLLGAASSTVAFGGIAVLFVRWRHRRD
jgi:nucleoside-diphosphate-sugar epimerase